MQVLNEVDETYEFLDMQREIDFVAGVVGWVPLTDSAACARALESMKPRGKLVGIRPLIAYEPDPDWLLQPSVRESLGLLARAGLVFEAIPVNDRQFEAVLTVTRAIPELKVVLNHLGNPPVPENGWEPWATYIARAAELTQHVDQALGRAGASGQMEMVDQGIRPLCRPRARSVRARPGDGRQQLAGG